MHQKTRRLGKNGRRDQMIRALRRRHISELKSIAVHMVWVDENSMSDFDDFIELVNRKIVESIVNPCGAHE